MTVTSTIAERLKRAMENSNISQTELAKRTGIGKSSISTYLAGSYEPKQKNIYRMAQVLNVNEAWLMGYDAPMKSDFRSIQPELPPNVVPLPQMRKVPLVGQIACGIPILAEQNIQEYIDLPAHINADYALTCKGESMINIGIEDGDIVYILQQEEVENGQVAAVRVGDDEATLKRFYYDEEAGIVQLVAENSTIAPKVFVGEAINQVHVIGRAIAYTHIIE